MSSIVRLLVSLYFLAVVGYVSWGTLFGLGLSGYLTGWMLTTFQWSSDELTATVLTIGLMLPAVPFLSQFKGENTRFGRLLLYGFCTLAPIILGFWGRGYLIENDREDQALVMREFSVSPTATDHLAAKNLVRLNGAYLVDAALRYSKEDYGEEHTLYVPLVAESFRNEAIEFVLAVEKRQDPPRFLPAMQGHPYIDLNRVQGLVPVTFEGLAIEDQLPVYCGQEWNEQGLHLDEKVYRLEARMIVGDKLPSRLGHLQPDLAVYLGLGFGFAMFLGFAIGEWKRRSALTSD